LSSAVPKPPAPLQFGVPEPGVKYRDRPAAFGIAERAGQIAVIQVTREGAEPFYDLPGGAIEPGESESRALTREFSEETGLIVSGGEILDCVDQFMVKSDGEPVNNRSTLMTVSIEGYDPGTKIEEDHKLAWLSPEEALRVLRLDSQAWAIACWLRRREKQAKGQAA
jgi:8-oxo-dGTP diphosphatase